TSRRFVVTRKFGRYWRHSRPERAFSPGQLSRKCRVGPGNFTLSRRKCQPPVLTSSNPISTLLQRFACARLSQPCLSESCSDFSATFTTIAFDDSSLPWLEINT